MGDKDIKDINELFGNPEILICDPNGEMTPLGKIVENSARLNPEDAAELDRLSVREKMQFEPLHIKPQMIKGELPIGYAAPIIGFDDALEPSICSLIIQSEPKINKPRNLKYPNKKRARRVWKKWERRFGATPGESIYFSDVEIITREEELEIRDNPLGVCKRLVAQVKKDSPRMFTKFLERQNEQLSKIFRNEHTETQAIQER